MFSVAIIFVVGQHSMPTSPRTPGNYAPTGHIGHAIPHRYCKLISDNYATCVRARACENNPTFNAQNLYILYFYVGTVYDVKTYEKHLIVML